MVGRSRKQVFVTLQCSSKKKTATAGIYNIISYLFFIPDFVHDSIWSIQPAFGLPLRKREDKTQMSFIELSQT